MYTRTGRAFLIVALMGLLNADAMALLSRCDLTPPPSNGWIVVAVFFQLCALAGVAFSLQFYGLTYQVPRKAGDDGRFTTVAVALICCFASGALFRKALLFSDTLLMDAVVSVGAACVGQ